VSRTIADVQGVVVVVVAAAVGVVVVATALVYLGTAILR